jgi:hypothetical protein
VKAYADDVILIANLSEGLQKLIRGPEQFYTFSNIKFNLKKCEIFKLNDPDDHEIIIAETGVPFASDLSYIKYLGVPIGFKRIAKKKFAEVKLQKIYSELDKLESSNLSINQKLKVIRNFISPQMNYIY